MKYLVLRGFVAQDRTAVAPGDVIDIEDAGFARPLIARGCITPHTAGGAAPAPPPPPAGAAPTAGAEGVATREPEPEHREPRTRRTPRG